MKKTTTPKQLRLSREAIRLLSASQLPQIAAGRRRGLDDPEPGTCDAGATCKPPCD